MGRCVAGQDRTQSVLFPERLDDWIHEDSTVRVIDVFVDELDLRKLGFERADPAATGRPGYSPATLLKIYVYGYLNRVQSSRRLETEAQRNLELIWLEQTEALKNVAADFIRCIQTGETPRSDQQLGLQVVAVLEAAQASIRQQGAPVSIA